MPLFSEESLKTSISEMRSLIRVVDKLMITAHTLDVPIHGLSKARHAAMETLQTLFIRTGMEVPKKFAVP